MAVSPTMMMMMMVIMMMMYLYRSFAEEINPIILYFGGTHLESLLD
jgi:hypothetical protein